MTSKARGMPSVELSVETKEALQAEKIENTPKPESEIFQKSNPELEVKPITEPPPDRPTTNLGLDGSRPTTNLVEKKDKQSNPSGKPKRKLTEKQLEGLRKGREKSLATRRAAKAKKSSPLAPKNHIEQPTPQSYAQPAPQQPPAAYPQPPVYISQPPSIDYDKIINGVADKWNSRPMAAMPTIKEEPLFDRTKFEADIRLNEKQKILLEIEQLQKEAEEKENQKTVQAVYNAPSNFSYAFEKNSRKRYNRY
tara:strand:+ start:88 stop:843 length:756 start_codon:yes stop_codon:yes gene_type:complete